MRDRIVEHLEKHLIIKDSQHQEEILMEEITMYLDSGYPVDVIYLDFQKVFDKVPHKRLVLKLAAHSIGGKILKWIENWLQGRKHRMVLGGHISVARYFERSTTAICIGPSSVC